MNRRDLIELTALAGISVLASSASGAQTKDEARPAAAPAPAAPPRRTRVLMLVYPGMTLLDLVGPLQVWGNWPGVEVQFAWKASGQVQTDAGLPIVATTTLADAWHSPDVLFVPGGTTPTFDLLDDADVIEFLRNRGAEATWVTSVCTGAVLLGAAGLLKGYRATTHWFAGDALALFGAIPVHERWVIDRNRATGGGVTAGIDFGLAVLAHVAGEDIARAAQLRLEYSPHPPFRSGTPTEATPETMAAVRAGWGNAQASIQAKMQAAVRRLQG
jgi:cyclohexyl-isocyanide hydratase